VKKRDKIGFDVEIDELTNSIKNVISGDSFSTDISRITKTDLKTISQKEGWQFDWKLELKRPERDVYKLTIVNNQSIIQGLISLEVRSDHVFMHLVESAPFNKGKTKLYAGIPGNLVAFACKLSFQRGHEGNIAFISKTQLIDHYVESLGAEHVGGRLMIIDSEAALKLINRYFSNILIMKTKKVELDVDFIGGQTSLTKEEEKVISDFIKKNKSKKTKRSSIKTKTVKQLI
jgi:SHS2 domain-containing protein